jgi:histidinol-phosphatase (PHP family)
MEEACASGLFTYIAHPEYFMKGRNRWNDRCIEVTHRICRAAEKAKLPMEVNLNGMRYGLQNYGELGERFAYPFYEFWQIVAQYDIKAVFGFDAHKPVTLTEDFRYNKVMEILNDLSFSWIEDPFSIIK